LPLPSDREAQAISDHLDVALKKQNTAIARTEREIALMQEYRTRLTADLVTGKLDVREAAAKLPDPPTKAALEPTTDENAQELESQEDYPDA
jgi:type I restriction enzyme S subunit